MWNTKNFQPSNPSENIREKHATNTQSSLDKKIKASYVQNTNKHDICMHTTHQQQKLKKPYYIVTKYKYKN